MRTVRLSVGRFLVFLILSVVVVSLEWTVRAAEPSFDLTARYILEIVRRFGRRMFSRSLSMRGIAASDHMKIGRRTHTLFPSRLNL